MKYYGQKTLLRIIFFERFGFRLLIVLAALLSAIFGLLLPYYQKLFSSDLKSQTLVLGVLFALLYFGFSQLTLFLGQYESLIAQKKVGEILYKHNLKLKPLTIQNKSIGEVVSLYATDVPSLSVWLEQSIPYGFSILFPLVLTPIFLNQFYNLSWYFSLGLVTAVVIVNLILAYRQSIFVFRFKHLAAARMGLVNEWIQNIRGLKVLNWVSGFEDKILKKREEETGNRISMVTNGQVMNAISSSINFWLNLAIIAYFVWIDKTVLSKSDLIGLIWLTGVFLARPFRQLPWFLTFLFDGSTSFKRLSDYLNLENSLEKINRELPEGPYLTEVKNLCLSVDDQSLLLKNIHLKIKSGEMVAVIGPVGAGKSLLLKSLLRETPFTADEFYCSKSSYLPQEHFVMSATLRDNINFNYNSDPNEDSQVMQSLAQAQFNFEQDRVGDGKRNGLDVMIGERGINLSGGQKQRVTLARQLRNPEKLIILDDPLSALDLNTESELIKEFSQLKKNGHSLILTTQRFTVLPHCDRVIYMEGGEILYDGSASEFLSIPTYQPFLKGELV